MVLFFMLYMYIKLCYNNIICYGFNIWILKMWYKGRIIFVKISKKFFNLKFFIKKEEEECVEEIYIIEEFDS